MIPNTRKLIRLLKELERSKELVWLDDDDYTVGYNAGIDMAIAIVKEKLCRKNLNYSMNGKKDSD